MSFPDYTSEVPDSSGTSTNKASIIFLLLLLWGMVACAPSEPSPSPHSVPYSFTPVPNLPPVGSLVISDLKLPLAPNPLFASTDADIRLNSALWGQPVFYDEQFRILPDQLLEVPLPENGGVLDGGKTIVMRLRPDLRWSDGEPIVAGDFAFWWRLNQDRATGATITGGYDAIERIETPDQYTVLLRMKQPFGPYLSYLPYAAPQHAWGQFSPIDLQNTPSVYQQPRVTSGPYRLVSVAEGESYTLEPNPYYVSTTLHGPSLLRLVYQAVDSIEALSSSLRSGQTDVALGYKEYDLPGLLPLPSHLQVQNVSAAAYEHLEINNAQPLLQDVRIRRAIQLAIDPCALLKTVLQMPDCSRRATQIEVPPSPFYDASLQPVSYDPAQAQQLLAQAGWKLDAQGRAVRDGQLLRLRLATTANHPLRQKVALEIQRSLLAIGIEVQITSYSLDSFFGIYTRDGILATGAYDLALFAYANRPEPDDSYSLFHSSQIPNPDQPSLGNYSRVNDPLIDQALTQGRQSVTLSERTAAYQRFLHRLADQVYTIPLYVDVNPIVLKKQVRNVIPNPNLSANLWNISDWWLADSSPNLFMKTICLLTWDIACDKI